MLRTRIASVFVAFVTVAILVAPAVLANETRSSDWCGSCHRDIYRMWRDSAHAEATEDPFFFESYQDLEGKNASLQRICLTCHAPLAIERDDLELNLSASREGVSCDFCHSLTDVKVTEHGIEHRLDLGTTKRGTIAEADSPAHGVEYSELHTKSIVCAPCHEYVGDGGLPILSTFSEWRESSASQDGVTCQSCHMAQTRARVVDPRVDRDSAAHVNLHEMPGGHSLQQLHKALQIEMLPKRKESGADVEVRVRNTGAGHAVPTGMPGRRILMVIEVDTSTGRSFREERVYSKTFLRADGTVIDHVADYFGKGIKLASDTRLGPDELRTEKFHFDIEPDETAYVTLKMHYEHAPRGDKGERVWLTFYSIQRLMKRAAGSS